MSAAAQQPSASAAEDDSPSLLSLPDTLVFVLCGFLEDRTCLALRATCSVLSAGLRGPDADLGIWKPRVEAILADQPQPAETASSYEHQLAFLRQYADLIGEYLWPLPVLGGAVSVRVLGPDRIAATLTLRPRVRMGSAYATLPLFDVTRSDAHPTVPLSLQWRDQAGGRAGVNGVPLAPLGGASTSMVTVSPQLGSSAWSVRRGGRGGGGALRLCDEGTTALPSPMRTPLAFLRAVRGATGNARIECPPLAAPAGGGAAGIMGPVGAALGTAVLPYLYGSFGSWSKRIVCPARGQRRLCLPGPSEGQRGSPRYSGAPPQQLARSSGARAPASSRAQEEASAALHHQVRAARDRAAAHELGTARARARRRRGRPGPPGGGRRPARAQGVLPSLPSPPLPSLAPPFCPHLT